jgi:ribose-phosphate pyrophosphokinase
VSGSVGDLLLHRFPDGESHVRLVADLEFDGAILVCSLHHPDEKFLPLIFAAATAREHGAQSVGLVAPYLAYMRQDARNTPGEGITSGYFADAISKNFDWLVTVDPHLHRIHALSDIYSIPAASLKAAPPISRWINEHVAQPLLIGPDAESIQWVSDVAKNAGAPFIVLEKVRKGDRQVEVSIPEIKKWRDRTPVLVDDIVSTGRTMAETIRHLIALHMQRPICIGVHGLFADDALQAMNEAGAARIVTCNTVPHVSNEIDVTDMIAEGVACMLTRA